MARNLPAPSTADRLGLREASGLRRSGRSAHERDGNSADHEGHRIAVLRATAKFDRKWRSRPLSRVLSWTTIPLGLASPQGSSSTPGCGPSQPIAPLFGLAPSGVYRAVRRCPRTRWALTPPFHPY